MWRILLVVGACGRIDFAPEIYDFTGLVPYVEDDFADDDGSFRDNAPVAIAAMPGGFAVSLGRAIVYVGTDGAQVVHDYRPVRSGGDGPDEIVKLTYGEGELWVSATSILEGDGVYSLDASWRLTRDNSINNVGGVAIDEVGAFDGRGVPTEYFTGGNKGVFRRADGAVLVPFTTDMGSVALAAGAMFTVDGDPTGPDRLWRVDPGTHAKTLLETSSSEQLVDGGGSADGMLMIRELSDLVRVAPDGTTTALASAPAGVEWRDATVTPSGELAVLEFIPADSGERIVVLR